jgi:L-aminopeptidase/D-esterase-like protein
MGKTASLCDLPGVKVGHFTDEVGLTGCTAILFPSGAVAGHRVAGVASGSRELEALSPRHLVERIHGFCLSGGSAFGLAAASGVARVLEAEGIGHVTLAARVPIVPAAVVYDLNLGDPAARPDEAAGASAARAALEGAEGARSGNVGAGTGVCAGKLLGARCATKTGLGHGGCDGPAGLQVAALAVVNPVGDVLSLDGVRILAGARTAVGSHTLLGSAAAIRAGARAEPLRSEGAHHTTLAVVATNARLSRVEAAWVAEQASVALARLIDPPFTRHDGDVVFAASTAGGDPLPGVSADPHLVGLLARDALVAAIVDACLSAEPAGGLPVGRELEQPLGS